MKYVLVAILTFVLQTSLLAQQIADTLFNPKVGAPAYKEGARPVVLFDEAHYNFHTVSGRYLAFTRLVRRDGYVVQPNRVRFARPELDKAKILVIANALAKENQSEWVLPTPSAFDSSEIAAVREWVKDGGSLLLIADHMPFAGAAEELAVQFGVLMCNGFAMIDGGDDGRIAYSRQSGSLADHPVTRGRNRNERVDSIVAFTGQAFRLEGKGDPLMTLGHNIVLLLPQVAWQFSKLTPAIFASGMLQGAVLQFGKGRVAVFGEAAMFSAQVAGPNRMPMGMNDPSAPQNPQFLLNVMHWLSGLL
ncbi:MAG TPA: hypothetical protein DGH68_03025 [Bacteroidetes bacterium]|nr:hypothetical protein [Bacteroidota bacterium]